MHACRVMILLDIDYNSQRGRGGEMVMVSEMDI
jgi:hypothetical protein